MADKEDTIEYEVEDGVVLDGDTKIEISDDTPEQDRGRSPMKEAPAEVTDEELTRYSDQKLKDRLAHLGKGYHEERRAKEAAARERDEAVRVAQQVVAENQRLQGSLSQNQQVLHETAKQGVLTEIEQAKQEYKTAHEAFDTDGIIAAQEKLTNAKIRADKVFNYVPPTVQQQQPVVQPQQPPPVNDKTRAWQDQNPWFGADEGMTAYALALHKKVVAAGVPVESEEYFTKIDSDVQKRFPEAFAGKPSAASNSRRTGANVAPAARSTASSKVVLTQTQVNLAKRLGLPLEVYARSVAELNRN